MNFARIISFGRVGSGPEYFRVWTKAGQVLDYGTSADSRIRVADADHVMVWALKEVRDAKENYLQYVYDVDRNRGEYWATRIDYAGNRETGLEGYARVNFEYEDRPDDTVGRIGRYPVRMSRRLRQIETRIDGGTVLTYNFRYRTGNATGRSRLDSIQLCDGNGVCFPATRIPTWTDGDSRPSFDVQEPYRPSPGYWIDANSALFLNGDIDGDGRTDFIHLADEDQYNIWLSKGGGAFVVGGYRHPSVGANSYHFVPGDFNGDGRMDFFHVASSSRAEVWNGTAEGRMAISVAAVEPAYGDFPQNKPLRYFAGDFNGDGRTDLIHIVDNEQAKILLSEGGARFRFVRQAVSEYRVTENDDNYFPSDVNGDGLTDLVHFNPSEVETRQDEYWTWISRGDGRFSINRHLVPATVMDKNKSNFQSGDFNGDGRTDFLHYFRRDACEIWLATTPGDFNRVTLRPQDLGTGIAGYHFEGRDGAEFEFHIADFNGDGRTDIIHLFSKTEIVVWRSLGDGRFAGGRVSHNGPHGYSLGGDRGKFRFQLGDFNGDGQSDFVHFYARDRAYVWQRGARLPDLPRAIVDGYGNRIELDYAPLTDESVYSPGTGAQYPVNDLRGPLYVVAEHRMSDGLGGLYKVRHHYAGARAHLQGRGFLGFETVEVTDTRSGLRSLTRYRQDFPFIGQVEATRVRQPDGGLISRVDNVWQRQVRGGNRYFVFNESSVSRTYELNDSQTPVTTTTTTSQFDDYGNPTRIVVDSGDGHRKTTISSYRNDAERWHLGRLLRSVVTSEAPGVPTLTRASAFDYTSNGLLRWEEIEPDQPAFRLRTTYDYDAYGNRTTATVTGADIATRTTTTEYDALGRFPRLVRNALGQTATMEHDTRFGAPVRANDANGLMITYQYDGFGRRLAENRPDGTRTLWAYLRRDRNSPDLSPYMTRTFVTGQEPETAYHDSLGRVIRTKEIGFDGRRIFQDTDYDELGRVSRVSRSYSEGRDVYWTRYGYDLLGRVTLETLPDGSQTATAYNGLRTTMTNPLGQTRTEVKN
ncbi:MAG TPA: FG-GAP-like repeat-containing protein, partial [Lacipirellulaceae bacterium]|nr:FG-GAP-like repeat-containing protein [Lacipirellulaceae bacterium]